MNVNLKAVFYLKVLHSDNDEFSNESVSGILNLIGTINNEVSQRHQITFSGQAWLESKAGPKFGRVEAGAEVKPSQSSSRVAYHSCRSDSQ